jgi:hypothetical protein
MAYTVTATDQIYGPRRAMPYVVQGEDGRGVIFANRKEAREYIGLLDDGVYYTGHNESGRPNYRIRTVAGLPAYLACQV